MAPTARSLGNARLSMLAKPRTLTTRAEFAADIRREWTNALEATVAVGRRLNEAKDALPHGEYEAMVTNDLPFSTSTARKLREIAAFVDDGKVPLDRLPEAMSTLYAIATLPEETRREALEQGVIRPNITRAEVMTLKPLPRQAEPRVPKLGRIEPLADIAEAEDHAAWAIGAVADVRTATSSSQLEAPLSLPRSSNLPTFIDVETLPVATPTLPELGAELKVSPLKGAISRPWSVNPGDRCSILVRADDGQDWVVLAGMHNDDATADLVQYVVDLHNAS